jgi:acetyltransferase-like isoleucine patch superfamily enzyme
MIFDTDFHEPLPHGGWGSDALSVSRPVKIGKGCFIGARSIILKGVTIGDGVVVGAGAVITRDIPADSIAYGNPAIYKLRNSTPS